MENSISNYVGVHKPSSDTRSDSYFELNGECSLFKFDLRYDRAKCRWYWTLCVHPFPVQLITSSPFLERKNAVEDINAFIHSYLNLYQDKEFDI